MFNVPKVSHPNLCESLCHCFAMAPVPKGCPSVLGPKVASRRVPKGWAELVRDKNSQCDTCETYIKDLMASVRERLPTLLKNVAGGINLQGTLEQQEPLQIDSKGQLQTTKEHWRWENCKMSLEKKGLYEAPGNLLWLSMDKPTWDGENSPATYITYGQVAAGRQLWSDEKFLRSSDDEQKRHYIINGSIPTAVTSAVDVPTKLGFVNLPCLSSRAVLCGWYSVVDDALRAQATKKVLKLYEAALSFPMRLRCGPSRTQICLDSISYSKMLPSISSVQRTLPISCFPNRGRPLATVSQAQTTVMPRKIKCFSPGVLLLGSEITMFW